MNQEDINPKFREQLEVIMIHGRAIFDPDWNPDADAMAEL